jgi:predicted membrane GTPase involved in stress response
MAKSNIDKACDKALKRIEWIGDDELVEVTPKAIRIRKRFLTVEDRRRQTKGK